MNMDTEKFGPQSSNGQLAVQCAQLVQDFVLKEGPHDPQRVVFSCLTGIAGILSVLSFGLGYKDRSAPRDEALAKAVSDQSILFAGLLAAAATKTYERDDMVSSGLPLRDAVVNFGPDTLLTAMEWYEKLTGEKPDPYLDDNMVSQVRQFAKEADQPLADFIKNRLH